MNDIDQLHTAEVDQKRDHHWKIAFEVMIAGEDEDWSFDERVVGAGPDSRKAVELLTEFIKDESRYGQKVLAFRMMDIKLLSVAEI